MGDQIKVPSPKKPQVHKYTSRKRREINVSPEQLKRVKGYQKMVAGVLFMIVPCVELYRRLYRDGERKMQEGEYNPVDGTIKKYTEEEKIEVDARFRRELLDLTFILREFSSGYEGVLGLMVALEAAYVMLHSAVFGLEGNFN
ncbi:hypothetical protein FOA43_003641 [Brettanomyces nanus]|uniref:Uncharacterized protein n=1 Tax=Eeniella nana TaxID=13502 RepID=A0A875S7J8_EENNA|nr:uncharacterized protein FOA43_003641 [Brettanomyces nanus]QPG76255.1 hypothetical protein FOA43_003641 [Brettanomyces nanus]